MKCPNCNSEVKEGAKFCTKCGSPISAAALAVSKNQTASKFVCKSCGNPLKPNQKFCTKCGTPVASGSPDSLQGKTGDKGWFTDGVRAVANAITGGALNRDIERQQQEAVRQQAREGQGAMEEVRQRQQADERSQRDSEQEAERARNRRNQEAIEGVDVVRGRAIWSIQPGQIARKITERELEEIEQLKGIIVQEGCSAIVFVNGELVSTLSAGAYQFFKSADAEKAAIRAAVEQAEKELAEKEQRIRSQQHKEEPTFSQLGIVGEIGRAGRWVSRLIFGEKKEERKEKVERRKLDLARVLSRATQAPIVSVYIVSERYITLTFAGLKDNNGNLAFAPYTIPTKLVDVNIGVSLQLRITDIRQFSRNYLADKNSVTTMQFQQMLSPVVENTLKLQIRNLDYGAVGFPEPVQNNLKVRIQQTINEQLYGIQCERVLQITDSSADFERFRAVERELYCSERELSFLQRTGEFRNRLAEETNKQTIEKATREEELRYALQQLNKDKLLHDDEMEQFVLLLNAQKRLREAKSKEEEYEALLDLKKSRLVKDDEMAALEDALNQNKIRRDSVTEIMRIQHQQSIDDARLKAQWALSDQKQDHDWEREDLERRRNWGIEDEEREREWMHEEQEYNRMQNRTQQQDEYEWQRRIREDDYEWQLSEREREADWQQRLREEQIRRENEQIAYERQRQGKFDDVDILSRKADIAMRNMQAMKEQEMRELQEKNRSTETIHSMNIQVELNRDNKFANMTAEQIRAAQLSHLTGDAQVAMANAYSKDGENELLRQQAEKEEARAKADREAAAKDKEDLMRFAAQMAGMVKDTASNVSGARFSDLEKRASEYREDALRQQDRVDRIGNQALDYTTRAHQTDSQSFAQAMGGVPEGFKREKSDVSQKVVHLQSRDTSHIRYCPACGAEVPDGEAFCGECGNKME